MCYSQMLAANFTTDAQAQSSIGPRPPRILPPTNSSRARFAQSSQSIERNERIYNQSQYDPKIASHQSYNIKHIGQSNTNFTSENVHHYIKIYGKDNGNNSSHLKVATSDQDGRQFKQIDDQTRILANFRDKRDINNTDQTETIDSSLPTPPSSSILASLSDISVQGAHICLDLRPSFVAQSSICSYVLSIGLSFYLFDLLLRKWRRSKCTVQLLNVLLDQEGNLIELVLSNNHKRFSHWMPGQFVYLNCPQIATYEWHPFTISSMDNGKGEFTLHIKTGGDWTRKLRQQLEFRRSSMSFLNCHQLQQEQQLHLNGPQYHLTHKPAWIGKSNIVKSGIQLDRPVLPDFDCYSETGRLQVECTKLVLTEKNNDNRQVRVQSSQDGRLRDQLTCQTPNCLAFYPSKKACSLSIDGIQRETLNLFIDGPFHSPFERLLEQQISICISNGVGWTAFSSVFQCITNDMVPQDDDVQSDREWWNKWRRYAIRADSFKQISKIKKLSETKLHLMVIVTSIEQLKPFYKFALDYFEKIQNECLISIGDERNPVREITALITRCKYDFTSTPLIL